MSKHTIPRLGKKHTLRTLLWLLAAVAVLVWMVQHPYQVRYGIDEISTFFTVLSGGGR